MHFKHFSHGNVVPGTETKNEIQCGGVGSVGGRDEYKVSYNKKKVLLE